MAVHSRKRDFDSDKRRGGEKESLCTSRPPTLGSQALLPRGRRVVEADDRPAARFSLVPVPRPHSASGGSVSCRCARLPRLGVQRSSTHRLSCDRYSESRCRGTRRFEALERPWCCTRTQLRLRLSRCRWNHLSNKAASLCVRRRLRACKGASAGQDRYGRNHSRVLLACCRLTQFISRRAELVRKVGLPQ